MRHTFLALALAAVGGFAVASCGSSSKGGGDMGTDGGGGGAQDMAVAKLNCLQVGGCVSQCVFNQMGDIVACYNMCQKQAKAGSAQKWASAFSCGQDYCFPPSDMLGKCVEVMGPTSNDPPLLCDQGQTYDQCKNATMGTCISCIENARNIIYADFSTNPPGPPTGMCPDPNSPDCKGGSMCTTLFNTCLADM